MFAAILVSAFLTQVEAQAGPLDHKGLCLNAPLTEAAMVTISDRAGIKVTTEHPTREVSDIQVRTYLDVFEPELRHHQPGRPHHPPPPPGHHHPRDKSPCEPE